MENATHGAATLSLPAGAREVMLSNDALTLLLSEEMSLRITTDDATIILPSSTLEQISTGDDALIGLNVTTRPDYSLTVNITVTIDGRAITNLVTPYTVQINASNLLEPGQNANRVIALDAQGNILGGTLNPTTRIFEFEANRTGNFTIQYIEELRRVNMQLDSPVISDIAQGESAIMDVAPLIQDGRTLLPVRFISESLGADVNWDEATSEVTLTRNNQTLTFAIGEMVSGMDVPAQIVNDRTVVPLRFIAEFFGATVTFDPNTGSIEIILM